MRWGDKNWLSGADVKKKTFILTLFSFSGSFTVTVSRC
jgi:hypothetical protein